MEVTRHSSQTRIARRRYINKPEDTMLTDLSRLLFDLFEITIRAVYRFLTKYMFATISSEEISQKAIGVNFFASFLPYTVSLKELQPTEQFNRCNRFADRWNRNYWTVSLTKVLASRLEGIRLSVKVSFFYRHVFYNNASLYKHET